MAAKHGSRKKALARRKGLLHTLKRVIKASRRTYRSMRNLPMTTSNAQVKRYAAKTERRGQSVKAREARRTYREQRARDRMARRGVEFGSAVETRRVIPFVGARHTRRASEEFGPGRQAADAKVAKDKAAPAVNLPPRSARSARTAPTTPVTPPRTTPTAGSSSSRSLRMTVGRTTALGVGVDLEHITAIAATSDLEGVEAALQKYAETLRRTFGKNLAEDTRQVFGGAQGGRGLVREQTLKTFIDDCSSAGTALSRAFEGLAKVVADERDNLLKRLAAEFGAAALDAAAKVAAGRRK
jgi:hypothetical protein